MAALGKLHSSVAIACECPVWAASGNAHSTTPATAFTCGALSRFLYKSATKCTQPPLSTRHASLRAAPRTTVPASIATSQPCFSSIPSAARAFGVSRRALGPNCTTGSWVSYGTQPTPGTAILDAYAYEKPSERERFVVLRCNLLEIDLVHLGARHRRAEFIRENEWAGTWLAP